MKNFMNFDMKVQSVFENGSDDFANFHSLMVDTARGVQKVSKQEANDKIREIFCQIIGVNEHSSTKEVRQAIRRNQTLIYDLLEDVYADALVSGWENNPFFEQFVETKNLAIGDRNEFYIPDNSVLNVMDVSGNSHDIWRQKVSHGRTESLTTGWIAVKVFEDFERIVTGRADFAALIAKVPEAINMYVREAVYNTMSGYVSSLPAAFKASGTLSADALRTLCETVSMATGKEVVIMGTRTALRSITGLQNASYISDTMKDEFNRTGLLGMWEGYQLLEIMQGFKKNDLSKYLVDNKTIYIMPVDAERPIKVVYEGDTIITQSQDQAAKLDMSYEHEVATKLGVGIIWNYNFGAFVIEG